MVGRWADWFGCAVKSALDIEGSAKDGILVESLDVLTRYPGEYRITRRPALMKDFDDVNGFVNERAARVEPLSVSAP